MGKFKPFFIGAIVGAGIIFFALQFHVVHTHDGIRVVARTPQHGLGLAYADIRTWDAARWNDFPELARALVANGSADLVSVSVAQDLMDSVANDSPIDQLRGMLNSDTESSDDPLFDDPGFLPLRESHEPTSFNSDSTMDDLLDAPFPRDANRRSFERESDRSSTVATRPDLSIENVFEDRSRDGFGGDVGKPQDDIGVFREETPSASRRRPPQTRESTRPALSREEETELLEDMLFGDDSEAGRSTGTGNTDSGFGVFEDVTSRLESRAEDAMRRARTGLRNSIDNTIDRTGESIGRFTRGQIESNLPDSVGSIFRDVTPGASSSGSQLPPELQALRDGFDPFVE